MVNKMVKNNGFRDGIKKEDILKSMTDEDWKRVHLWKSIEETAIKNEDAYKCSSRSDQMYQDWHNKMGQIDATVFQLSSLKSRLDKDNEQLVSGVIYDKYPDTDKILSKRDLEINTLLTKQRIGEGRRTLWLLLADVYRYVGQPRIDRVIFFSEEDYNDKLQEIKAIFHKQGIEMYDK